MCKRKTNVSIICFQVHWWWSWNTVSMEICPTSCEARGSSSCPTGYENWAHTIPLLPSISSWTNICSFLLFDVIFVHIFRCHFHSWLRGGASRCALFQDRSPKTQSQVRRMIEAGQVEQRGRPPPPAASTPHVTSSRASNQSPAVEKSESPWHLEN